MMGLVAICILLPSILFSLLGGVWADKYGKKPMMILCNTGMGILMLALLLFSYIGLLTAGLILVVAFLTGVFESFFTPSEFASIPQVAGTENIQSGQALLEMSSGMVGIMGLAIGGAIYGLLGVRDAFLIDALAFFASAMLICMISPLATPEKEDEKTFATDIKEGIKYITRNRVILTIFFFALLMNFGGAPLSIMLPLYSTNLSLPAEAYGFMMSALAAGSIVGFWISGARSIKGKHVIFYSELVGASFILLAAPLLLKSFVGGAVALALVFILGIWMGQVNVPISTIMLRATHDEFRGRVGSVGKMASLVSTPLSLAIFGSLADKAGVLTVLMVCGSLIIACTTLFVKSDLCKIEYQKEAAS
jgi:MFS family permease